MNRHRLLRIIALVCFGLAAIGIGLGPISPLALGLFFWLLTEVI